MALRNIAGTPIHGPFSRAVKLEYFFPKPAAALPVVRASYTPKNSFERIYITGDMVTALAEVVAIIAGQAGPPFTTATGPWVVVAIHGVLSSVLDLTAATNMEALGSNYQELTGAWRYLPGVVGEPPTHTLGRLCHKSKRFDAIRFPSSKNPLGVCLAVFPDRLKAPAYLEVYDPQNNVAQRLP